MAATTVAAASFRDINLGPETPLEILAQAARHYEAKLVWLAVSVAQPMETLQEEVDRLAAALAAQGGAAGDRWPGGAGRVRRAEWQCPRGADDGGVGSVCQGAGGREKT